MGQRWGTFLERLPKVQMIVGLTAGLLSISGAVYSVMSPSRHKPALGEVLAVVEETRSNKAIRDATVEILTPTTDALVTRLTSRPDGRARIPLRAGDYRLRVSHPDLGRDIRPIHVLGGQTTEIHVELGPRPTPVARKPLSTAATNSKPRSSPNVTDKMRKFFRDLTR
jgi:hypothetical protein